MKIDGTLSRTMAIIMPGSDLSQPAKPDQRIVAMAAHGELDRIGDDLARHQRRLHALVAHGDAVGDGDGAEFARRAVGGGDALLDHLRLAHQRDVAGRRLVPAAGDADQRLRDLGGRQSHRIEIGAMRRTRRTDGHMAAGQLGLGNDFGVHFHPCRGRAACLIAEPFGACPETNSRCAGFMAGNGQFAWASFVAQGLFGKCCRNVTIARTEVRAAYLESRQDALAQTTPLGSRFAQKGRALPGLLSFSFNDLPLHLQRRRKGRDQVVAEV